MRRILITKDVAYAAKIGGGTIAGINEVNLLDDGAIAVFTQAGVLITVAAIATVALDVKKVYYAVGSGSATTGAWLSSEVDRASIRVEQKDYVAPVLEVQFIGNDGATGDFNLPSPLVVGTSAIIRTIDTSAGTQPPIVKKTYEYQVKTGDTTVEIADGLEAIINGDPDRLVNAVVVGAGLGLELDTIAVDKHIEILGDGILANATIETNGASNAVAPVYGSGTPAQMRAVETEYSAVEGNTNQIYQPAYWFSKPSAVGSSTTYNMTVLTWNDVKDYPTRNTVATRELLILAFNATDAGGAEADIFTIHTELYGVNRINSEVGA